MRGNLLLKDIRRWWSRSSRGEWRTHANQDNRTDQRCSYNQRNHPFQSPAGLWGLFTPGAIFSIALIRPTVPAVAHAMTTGTDTSIFSIRNIDLFLLVLLVFQLFRDRVFREPVPRRKPLDEFQDAHRSDSSAYHDKRHHAEHPKLFQNEGHKNNPFQNLLWMPCQSVVVFASWLYYNSRIAKSAISNIFRYES